MKSTLGTMTLSLVGISVVMAAALVGVNLLTQDAIARSREEARRQAVAEVLPAFDNDPTANPVSVGDCTIYIATNGGQSVGAAVETYTDEGFSGRFTILAGFDAKGAVSGYRVLEHSETPGLGARMASWFCEDGTGHNILGLSLSLIHI